MGLTLRQVTICTGTRLSPNFARIRVCVDIGSSAEQAVIPAHGKALVDTKISIALPLGTYGRVAPRSGLGKFSGNYISLIEHKSVIF